MPGADAMAEPQPSSISLKLSFLLVGVFGTMMLEVDCLRLSFSSKTTGLFTWFSRVGILSKFSHAGISLTSIGPDKEPATRSTQALLFCCRKEYTKQDKGSWFE